MYKKITFPKYQWIDVPSEVKTITGTYLMDQDFDLQKISERDEKLLEYLRNLNDIDDIIKTKYNGSLGNFCRDICRNLYGMTSNSMIWYIGKNLENFLLKFKSLSGNKFEDDGQMFTYTQKIKFDLEPKLFDCQEDAIRYIVKKEIPEYQESTFIIKIKEFSVEVSLNGNSTVLDVSVSDSDQILFDTEQEALWHVAHEALAKKPELTLTDSPNTLKIKQLLVEF